MLGLKLNLVSKRGHWSAPSPYLNQCWLIVNCKANFSKNSSDIQILVSRECIWKCHLYNVSHFGLAMARLKMYERHPDTCLSCTLHVGSQGHLVIGFLWYVTHAVMMIKSHMSPLRIFNPLRAKFFRGNVNIYFHLMPLLHIDLTQVLKILPQVRPGPTYST